MSATIPGYVPLAVATRGGAVENVYYGAIAVVDDHGKLLAHAGDAAARVFARSTLKPLQALPFVAAGGLGHYGWGEEEAALLCASHSGEARQLAIVANMLAQAGLDVRDLGCGSHVPSFYAASGTPPPADAVWSPLHNNCSGKHAGFLAYCRWRGWPLASYLDPGHPLQVEIRQALADFAGVDADALPCGIDGCSAPIYALPLARLAYAYARLAAGGSSPYGAAAATLATAMRRHPELVSGQGRADLALARAGGGDWLAKVGADGVQAFASVARGLGLAIKIADGNLRALHAVSVEALRQLGLLDAQAAAALAAFARPPIENWRGTETGRVEPCLSLERPQPIKIGPA